MKNVVLVTGAAGFIGSHICDLLVKKNYKVIGVDNLKQGDKRNLNKKIIFENIDLNNAKSVEYVLEKYHPSQIIHHASNLVSVALSVKHPEKAYKDVAMTINLLNIASNYDLKHFIFASSANVYGNPKELPIKETFILQPESPYGLAKEAIEKFIEYYYNKTGITYTIFRYFNVYGERQSNSTAAIPSFIDSFLKDKPITIKEGRQTRDFIYVKDVAYANYLALEKKPVGIFNIGSGKTNSINNLVKALSKLTGKKCKLIVIAKSSEDLDKSQASIKKAIKVLRWKPSTKINEGLENTIKYYKSLLDKPY